MGKFLVALFLVLFTGAVVAATLQGVGEIERCWVSKTLPDELSWATICDNQTIGGEFMCSRESGAFGDGTEEVLLPVTEDSGGSCWCRMTYPYVGVWAYAGELPYSAEDVYEMCSYGDRAHPCKFNCRNLWINDLCDADGTNDGGDCESDYGLGFEDEVSRDKYLSVLFATEWSKELPCEIGVSRVMLSTGNSFALYAEKYTERALVVQYNDQKCYGKLESGRGILNIRVDGEIYHLVE